MAVVYSFRDPIICARLDSIILQRGLGRTTPHRNFHDHLHGHRTAENHFHDLLAT